MNISNVGGRVVDTIVGIAVAVVGVAILAVLVAPPSKVSTVDVIKAAGKTMTGILGSAFGSIGSGGSTGVSSSW